MPLMSFQSQWAKSLSRQSQPTQPAVMTLEKETFLASLTFRRAWVEDLSAAVCAPLSPAWSVLSSTKTSTICLHKWLKEQSPRCLRLLVWLTGSSWDLHTKHDLPLCTLSWTGVILSCCLSVIIPGGQRWSWATDPLDKKQWGRLRLNLFSPEETMFFPEGKSRDKLEAYVTK